MSIFNEIATGGIIAYPSVLVTSVETKFASGGTKIPKTTVLIYFDKHFKSLKSDTICFLSGGPSNGDPLLSVGGEVSITQAGGDLFDDFRPEESTTGLEDYRCIYVYNALANVLNEIQIWIESPISTSAEIVLGVNELDDVQEINLSFFSGIGSFTLDFDGINVVINADSDLDVFAQNFQDALRDNTSLTDVTVQALFTETTVNFKVVFTGVDGHRKQPVFALVNNGLGGSPTITINQTTVGSPINSTAEVISTDITNPLNPEFRKTTQSLPIVVPTLAENEGFPLWIKRTVAANPDSTENDGFFLKIITQSIAIV